MYTEQSAGLYTDCCTATGSTYVQQLPEKLAVHSSITTPDKAGNKLKGK